MRGVCRSLIATFLFLLFSISGAAQEMIRLDNFRVTEDGKEEWIRASVPGTIQADLIREGIIPHHFVGGNEDSVQWVSDTNWIYLTEFDLDGEKIRESIDYLLHLEWVDTYSEVYVNGACVGKTENLFRKYSFPVKNFLRPGKNQLVIRLLSPTKIAHAQYLSNGFNYPADNDRNPIKYSPFVRKSPYHFGWDWGPRLISMGLGAAPDLEQVTGSKLGDIYVRSEIKWKGESALAESARVEVTCSLDYCQDFGEKLSIALLSPLGEVLKEVHYPISSACETIDFSTEIFSPELWMPNGWGAQPLYSIIRKIEGNGVSRADTTFFGVREVKLQQVEDKYGKSFTFVVNNRPLYAKGANYLPHDRRFGGGGKSLKELFEHDLVPAHFNMLRVWGGGTYETEEFYHLADKYGILIWQDFPFACTTYPNDPRFVANVTEEVKSQLSRLRNHPSLAFLCGNNEVLEGLKHWGWKRKYGYTDEVWKQMFANYDDFFRRHLSELVATLAPHLSYMHGSPYDSNWGIPESFLSSDSHNWRVWFGGKDFTEFDENPGRFVSEFGFQSFPEMKTIQSFAPGYDLDTLTIESPILKHRQRSFIGNQRITDYMERDFPVPTVFSDYVYVGQLLHGRGMAYALRALRRAYPQNMGSLYWQLNDVWPTVSWSSIDYWGNYKALHYEVRKAYAPYVIDVVDLNEGELSLWVSSDSYQSQTLRVEFVAKDFFGREIYRDNSIVLNNDGKPFARQLMTLSRAELPTTQMYVELELKTPGGQLLASEIYYPEKPKNLRLPNVHPNIVNFKTDDGKLELTLSSPALIYGLFIGTPWQGARYSENYFDLLPGTTRTITILHDDITPDTTLEELTFQSLNQILAKYEADTF